MNTSQQMFRNSAVFLAFVCLITAGLFFELNKTSTDLARIVSYVSLALVVVLSLKRPHVLPLLMLLLLIKLLQIPITIYFATLSTALYYYLSSALLDLLLAFFIVHYHNDEHLMRSFASSGILYLMFNRTISFLFETLKSRCEKRFQIYSMEAHIASGQKCIHIFFAGCHFLHLTER